MMVLNAASVVDRRQEKFIIVITETHKRHSGNNDSISRRFKAQR
jgi:hypothetical protein